MPRFAITTGTRHGATAPVVITGPEVSIDAQKAAIKELTASRENPEWSEVQLWTSDSGIDRKIRFKPATQPEPKKGKQRGNADS